QTHHRTVAQAERDRRAANSQATRLRAQEGQTRTEITLLDRRLVDAGRRRADAEAAAAAAQDRLAALRLQMEDETAELAHSGDAFESALIAAAFSQRQIEPRSVRAGIFARAAAPQFQLSVHNAAQSLARDRLIETDILNQQIALANAQSAIDAE